MAKRKRNSASTQSNTFKAPTVGEVREFLGRYDADRPFFTPNVQDHSASRDSDIEFYRRMYRTLRSEFTSTCSASESNGKKIQQMTGRGLDNISREIILWHDEPRSFWEAQAKALPEYSALNKMERLAGFITRAVSLELETKIQQVQRRFIAVSAYRFFTKIIPTSEQHITETVVLKFLRSIRLSECSIKTSLETCITIIRRGRRCSSLCETLSPPKTGWPDYGLLLDPELPDSIFIDDKRLSGKPRKTAIEHLKKSWRPSCLDVARDTARILIEYNEAVCWIESNEEQASSRSLPTSSLVILDQETSSSEPRHPADTGRLYALAAAAEVSRPTTQQGSNSNGSDTSDIRTGRIVVEGQRDGTADDAYDTSAHAHLNNNTTGSKNSSRTRSTSQLTQSPEHHGEGFDETEKQLGGTINDFTPQTFTEFLNNDEDFDLNDGSKLDLDHMFNDWNWWSGLPQD
ncbi:hypothetical protein H634G_10820 [Metarhizium anisopliae BRIP 53293]|uniref:Uncharacterized protein n=1 Tax=Metarhizium anisopliae BRIP 53293 TaxID=1291518 RepID=A0A0D9NIW7_METAN|nr:hypothetical protein H634G_10820 [Metarhizium anisopliae BRIP 53293]